MAAGLTAAAERPGPVRDALAARVDELARHLATCCLLLDPQRMVLVGGVAGNELIRGLLDERLRAVLPYPPETVLSRFADDAALLGAVILARERSRRPGKPTPASTNAAEGRALSSRRRGWLTAVALAGQVRTAVDSRLSRRIPPRFRRFPPGAVRRSFCSVPCGSDGGVGGEQHRPLPGLSRRGRSPA
ncbi:ROK family protein [Micromonospora sp. NPDC020750]|uniref:ROK family protein n=1 Tax=unclassified Micromonospora TaxID=2617518 RepID=UPI00378FA144